MARYMMLLNVGGEGSPGSPEEMQAILKRYGDWARGMAEAGKLDGGEKLMDEPGRLLRKKSGRVVVDGPFAETKEMVGGFFIIKAKDYAEAADLAKSCPHLDGGGSISLREIEELR